ncbi:MAG: hypothetical protein HOM34_00120 [Planctomycetes bacterium]|jgi:hypothetical protein|nr:hypothetical protein [Planctomycetota bacterium]MBT4029844.1 hypothetical protein [Planctomycetota bacterium]MBT4559938.1 hypothetical protein [Planctomycetota bacterium]MBT5100799.1 hypothetical protein [Planctomycetota bacterium]MBT5119109.1 hypothetical protein [Planctomycetota bacterium]
MITRLSLWLLAGLLLSCQGTGYGDYQQAVFIEFTLTQADGSVLASPKIIARKNRNAELNITADDGSALLFWVRPEHHAGGPFQGKMRLKETTSGGQSFEHTLWLDLSYRGEWSFGVPLSNGHAQLEVTMRLHPQAEMEETLGFPRFLYAQ